MILTYAILSTVLLLFISVIWSKNGWPNILIKLIFIASFVYGVVVSLHLAGWLIAIPGA